MFTEKVVTAMPASDTVSRYDTALVLPEAVKSDFGVFLCTVRVSRNHLTILRSSFQCTEVQFRQITKQPSCDRTDLPNPSFIIKNGNSPQNFPKTLNLREKICVSRTPVH